MRVDYYLPAKPCPDPLTGTGQHFKFTDKHSKDGGLYDLYCVSGAVYVCRNGRVAVMMNHGVAIVSGKEGERLSADLAKKYPPPAPAEEKK